MSEVLFPMEKCDLDLLKQMPEKSSKKYSQMVVKKMVMKKYRGRT